MGGKRGGGARDREGGEIWIYLTFSAKHFGETREVPRACRYEVHTYIRVGTALRGMDIPTSLTNRAWQVRANFEQGRILFGRGNAARQVHTWEVGEESFPTVSIPNPISLVGKQYLGCLTVGSHAIGKNLSEGVLR